TFAETDWPQVVLLYDALMRIAPSPVVALNRAVAVAETGEVERAWRQLEGLELRHYAPYHAVCGYVLALRGKVTEARASYEEAIVRTDNDAEREALRRRRDALAR